MRIYVKPAVRWIWWGAFVIALGGVLAMFDKRYRKAGRIKPVVISGHDSKTKHTPKLPTHAIPDVEGTL